MEMINEQQSCPKTKEKSLIRQIKQGDHQAFSRIIAMYQQNVFKLALGFFHDRDDAMEIVQETFLRIFQKINSFQEETHFRNWVYRIASNLCIDYYRKFKKKSYRNDDLYKFLVQNSHNASNPEDQVILSRLKEYLKCSISLLPKRQKLILVLKHFNNFKYREIADILNISVGSVKSLHHRSVNNLKKRLANVR